MTQTNHTITITNQPTQYHSAQSSNAAHNSAAIAPKELLSEKEGTRSIKSRFENRIDGGSLEGITPRTHHF